MDFSEKWFQDLKEKIDIVNIIQEFVPLQKKGTKFWACCPFHNENTPSFTVNQENKYYHCFGCGKTGDAIKFLQEYQKMSFNEAVEWIAKKIGFKIPVGPESNEAKKRRELKNKILEVNKLTAEYYFSNFQKPEARVALEYLRKRELSDETIVRFGMGCSLDDFGMVKFLKGKGYSEQTIKDAGLLNSNGNDIFARRIIIPIIDKQGDVLGFGGRAIFENDKPKYKNTPQSVLFDKSSILFGINLISKYRKDRVDINALILVEGYMDVISLNQAGIVNVIASMGTSLTIQQCEKIKTIVNNVYVCFDGDAAGQNATWRSLDMLANAGGEVKVISIPDKMDPDDYVKKYGKDGFEKLTFGALPLNEYKVVTIERQSDLSSYEGRVKFVNRCIKALNTSDKIVLSLYSEMIANIAGIEKTIVFEKLESFGKENDADKENVKDNVSSDNNKKDTFSGILQSSRVILAACFLDISRFNHASIIENLFQSLVHKKIWEYCREKIQSNNKPILGALMSGDNDEIKQEIFEIETVMQYLDSLDDPVSVFNEKLNFLERSLLDNERIDTIDKIMSERDPQKRKELNIRLNKILDAIKRR
jgi:DNA primase